MGCSGWLHALRHIKVDASCRLNRYGFCNWMLEVDGALYLIYQGINYV